jgi:chromate transporter
LQPNPGTTPTFGGIFAVFVKIGSIVYGSGYVLLAFLRSVLVDHLHWLTTGQLLDATAVGQFTPGPVFTTATFIGYVVAGPWGALAATLGIFLPAFALVAVSGPLVHRLRSAPTIAGFLDGVNAASVALMVLVTLQLARAAIVDIPTAAIASASAVLLIRFRINSAWLVLAGAAAGFAFAALK